MPVKLAVNRKFIKDMAAVEQGVRSFTRDDLVNLNPLWNETVGAIQDVIRKQFEQEGIGRRWKRLQPDYRRWKEQNYPGRKILELTGRLKAAATGKSGEWYIKKERKKLEYGVRGIPYAEIHAKGGVIPRHFVKPVRKKVLHWVEGGEHRFSKGHWVGPTRIPQRNYLSMPRSEFNPIRERMSNFLTRSLAQKIARERRRSG
jgi:phage gpG-like protein